MRDDPPKEWSGIVDSGPERIDRWLHENLAGFGILCYGGYKAVFIKLRLKFEVFFEILFRTQLTDSLTFMNYRLRRPLREIHC